MLDGKWAAFWFRDYETVESSTGQNLVFVHTSRNARFEFRMIDAIEET